MNDPFKAASVGIGPIPPDGHDMWSRSDRRDWFALYAKGTLSDFTFVQGIKRGRFRLHPIGRMGIGEGCITMLRSQDFEDLAGLLRGQPAADTPGTKIRYYETVFVK